MKSPSFHLLFTFLILLFQGPHINGNECVKYLVNNIETPFIPCGSPYTPHNYDNIALGIPSLSQKRMSISLTITPTSFCSGVTSAVIFALYITPPTLGQVRIMRIAYLSSGHIDISTDDWYGQKGFF